MTGRWSWSSAWFRGTVRAMFEARVSGKQLHADSRVIAYGRKSIELAEVEWVSYRAVHRATKRFLYPTTHDSQWFFEVGRYPYKGAAVAVNQFVGGRREDAPEYWTFLVSLSQRYLEPRLLADLVDRVRGGETVLVGGALRVNRDGIACLRPRFSLPWREFGGARASNGAVWIYQAGVEKPLTATSLRNPNAVLVPPLLATFTA